MSWLYKIDYLDLASLNQPRQIVTLDQNRHLCYIRTRDTLHFVHS